MAIRRYIVHLGTDLPNPVQSFQDAVFTAVQDRQPLQVTALPVPDELSQRRGPATPEAFTFRVTDIHTDPDNWWVLVQNTETNEWSTIVVQDDTVSFSVVD